MSVRISQSRMACLRWPDLLCYCATVLWSNCDLICFELNGFWLDILWYEVMWYGICIQFLITRRRGFWDRCRMRSWLRRFCSSLRTCRFSDIDGSGIRRVLSDLPSYLHDLYVFWKDRTYVARGSEFGSEFGRNLEVSEGDDNAQGQTYGPVDAETVN